MARASEPSRRIAQNPAFALKARQIASRHGAASRTHRGWRRIGLQGVVRTVLALWCFKIAVVTAQGPTAQSEFVARLDTVSPVIATLAAPDPLTRGALAVRYTLSDWSRAAQRIF